MSNALLKINYPFNLNYLKSLYFSLKNKELTYNDERYGIVTDWKIIRVDKDNYIDIEKQKLGIPNAKARFYTLMPNSYLPEHTDNNTKCSINVILSSNNAPVCVEGKNYYYTQCLLNTQLKHSVTNGPAERILFKLSIFEYSFEEMKIIIKDYIK